jgi:hypothetical protein
MTSAPAVRGAACMVTAVQRIAIEAERHCFMRTLKAGIRLC